MPHQRLLETTILIDRARDDSPPVFIDHVDERRRRACALGLLLVLLALVPLAGASPPDPLWIAGIYDGADLDEVVVAVISAAGVVENSPSVHGKPAVVITGTVRQTDATLVPAGDVSALQIRAPPPLKLSVTA